MTLEFESFKFFFLQIRSDNIVFTYLSRYLADNERKKFQEIVVGEKSR